MKKTLFTVSNDTNSLAHIIQMLLSLDKNSTITFTNISGKMRIKFTGDKLKLQKIIYNWLSVPERLKTFLL